MKIAITGHRPNKLDNDYKLTSPLILAIRKQIEVILDEYAKDNKIELITGMALGIDTLFARVALVKQLPFTAAIPFKGQDARWVNASRDEYWGLLAHADAVVDTSLGVTFKKGGEYIFNDLLKAPMGMPFSREGMLKAMQDRNKWMVDNCDKLIAVWDGTTGGTNNCLQYALSKGLKMYTDIIWIDPRNIRMELQNPNIFKGL